MKNLCPKKVAELSFIGRIFGGVPFSLVYSLTFASCMVTTKKDGRKLVSTLP